MSSKTEKKGEVKRERPNEIAKRERVLEEPVCIRSLHQRLHNLNPAPLLTLSS